MREIKFRARHKESGTWDYGSSETKLEDCSSVPLRTFWEWVQIGKLDPETVGEFTGLKDKNGKEIYEGDILRNVTVFDDLLIVEWADDFAYWIAKYPNHPKEQRELLYAASLFCEVIGNIYENGELIKEE